MSFADPYLIRQKNPFCFLAPCLPPMALVVVIPCYDEPDIGRTIASLASCDPPGIDVGIVVVVNSSEHAPARALEQNTKTIVEIEELKAKLPVWLNFFVLEAHGLPAKWAGVGWARKIGMDWALSHFNMHGNSNGIIASLDADTLVAPNYLASILHHFIENTRSVAATVYFEHCTEDNGNAHNTAEAVVYYELYMRYFKHALRSVGFPEAIYTIGSAFAVKAKPYADMGGMNRKKAGEDFYFLHKMVRLGAVTELNTTVVYPSARVSERVPFGTGPALKKWADGDQNLLYVYPYEAFQALEGFFKLIPNLYRQRTWDADVAQMIHPVLLQFLNSSGFNTEANELLKNCSNVAVFAKRFFHLFNAFKIIKWLNYASLNGFDKQMLLGEAKALLLSLGFEVNKIPEHPKLMLNFFRGMDRNAGIH